VKQLIEDVKSRRTGSTDWFNAATALIQAATGARWIEAAIVSQFKLSDIPKFNEDLYIVAVGVAKETGKALKKFYREYQDAVSRGDEDAIVRMADTTQQDLIETIPDKVIVKPCLFHEFGITPKVIVDLSIDVKQFVANQVPRKPSQTDVQFRSAVSKKLYQSANNYFKSLWTSQELRKFNNTTHTWRKLYVSYSFWVYGGNGSVMNKQAWIEDTLGHTNVQTSFSYSNVVVRPAVTAQDPNLKAELAVLRSQLESMQEILEKLQAAPARVIIAPEPINASTIPLPALDGAGDIEVAVFTGLKRRFKPSQVAEKAAFVNDTLALIKTRLEKVDILQVTDKEWTDLGVPRDIGRMLVKLQ
jgi:hypothetical protein